MKNSTPLTILALLASLFAGCSKHPAASTSSRTAFDAVEAGKDTKWSDGVLRVTERDGTSIRGVQFTERLRGGEKRVLTADTGTIQRIGSDTVFITLTNARMQFGDGSVSNYPGNYFVELNR
jgi:hypothetical protein